ncbi:MAG: tyrosine-type recombinase/integrase [Parasporobacterium sp.]|nr:tyrosine-type recombinase/integrase [Parasporobacterium sp.]
MNRKKYSSHSLRATAATNLYLKTRDIFQVQMLLHHTTPEMTMKYIKDLDISERLRHSMCGSLTK